MQGKFEELSKGDTFRTRRSSESTQPRINDMKRKASAVWRGDLKSGKGTISSESGVLKETQYSFNTRFENGAGTNPEELIAAAHAGCFSMAFSAELGKAGLTPDSIQTTATVTLDKTDAGFTVTESHLHVVAKIPGVDEATFQSVANAAKAGCPISRLLKADIKMDARLES
jgi:osmotically inducible protein OsmC